MGRRTNASKYARLQVAPVTRQPLPPVCVVQDRSGEGIARSAVKPGRVVDLVRWHREVIKDAGL